MALQLDHIKALESFYISFPKLGTLMLLQILCYLCYFSQIYLLSWYQTRYKKNYINIFPKIMVVFGFSVQSISGLSPYFILRPFVITKFIRWNIVGTFWSLFAYIRLKNTITVNPCHLFVMKFLWLSISCRSPERKLGSARLG